MSPSRAFAMGLLVGGYLCGLLWCTAARAGTATAQWTLPTLNTDGSPASIAGFTLSYGRCNAPRTAIATLKGKIQTSGLSLIVRKLGTGAWCFSVIAKSTQGVSSAPSNVANKVI
jgi:hypothetical protein